jgi:hypothetical protein
MNILKIDSMSPRDGNHLLLGYRHDAKSFDSVMTSCNFKDSFFIFFIDLRPSKRLAE